MRERSIDARPRTTALASGTTLVITVVLLAAIAFTKNWSVVRDLSWPGLDIQFRELAAAQTLIDQGYGPDAAYLNEHVWYNPMASWLAAAVSGLTRTPLPIVVARAGPFVNLAAPAMLFLLVATTVDASAAAAAMAGFIFLIGTEFPFYYSAGYSPWFAPENFGQAFLYLLLTLAYRAGRSSASMAWSVACGAILGVTFLVHTAPAIVGGLVIVAFALLDGRSSGRPRMAVLRIGVALAAAFVVSFPFSYYILWHYHLRILNQFPSQSPSDLLDLNELPGLARALATWPVVVAAVALAGRAVRGADRGMRLLFVWLATVALLLGLHLGSLVLAKAGIHVPAIVPPFHFFFYFMAITAVGFGLGVRDGSEALSRWLSGMRRPRAGEARTLSGILACAVTLLWVAAAHQRYAARADFTDVRRTVDLMNRRYPSDLLDWIRVHTSPDDVFLCSDDASMYVVTPSGRKVVATNRYFSNPYVDWASRDQDRRRMFDALQRGDVDGFAAIARKYDVRFVVLSQDRSDFWLRAAGLRGQDLPDLDQSALSTLRGFTLALRTERFVVARFRPPPPSRAGL